MRHGRSIGHWPRNGVPSVLAFPGVGRPRNRPARRGLGCSFQRGVWFLVPFARARQAGNRNWMARSQVSFEAQPVSAGVWLRLLPGYRDALPEGATETGGDFRPMPPERFADSSHTGDQPGWLERKHGVPFKATKEGYQLQKRTHPYQVCSQCLIWALWPLLRPFRCFA